MEVIFDEKNVKKLFAPRPKDSHKGTFGTLVIIGGCERYVGAPYLASLGASALRTGCGIVRIAVPRFLLPALQARVTECTLFPLPDRDGYIECDENALQEATKNASAVICGMGIGDVEETQKIVKYVAKNLQCPVLFDADALNALSRDKSVISDHQQPMILTPHVGEMARLCGKTTTFVKENKKTVAREFASEFGVTVLLKDSKSVICDGTNTAINTSGTPAMAKGGSGDLLSGVIGGLLARGTPAFEAAAAGAFIAGKAAEKAVANSNEYSLLPSETATFVAQVITEMING